MIEEYNFKENKSKKICIIDNYPIGLSTDRISRIESILSGNTANIDVETIHFSKFNNEDKKDYVGFVLSGSSYNVSEFYDNDILRENFEQELDLIRNCEELPILGICFGVHLIAYAFNGKVSRMRIPGLKESIIFISLEKTDDLIKSENIPVNVRHKDFVSPNDSQILNSFEVNAISKTKWYKMVQYIRHKEKLIFGVQFHPETHFAHNFNSRFFDKQIVEKTKIVGKEIINNFLWLCSFKMDHPE